jgi:uncharacterized protein (DUF2062 family)
MLFRSREAPSFWQRVRIAVWPRVSFGRSARYFRQRVVRLSGSPHAIALGIAIGVAVSFTPFIGFHTLLAIGIAFLLGGNLIAAALGTVVGNPLTFPIIWGVTYRLGKAILGTPHVRGEENVAHSMAVRSFERLWPLLKPMLVGAVPLALVTGVLAYVLVYQAIVAFRALRLTRMEERRVSRAAKLETPEGSAK